MRRPRLVVRYLTGLYQILGELSEELAANPPPFMGPLDFGDHIGSVALDPMGAGSTYFLYREIEPDATIEHEAATQNPDPLDPEIRGLA